MSSFFVEDGLADSGSIVKISSPLVKTENGLGLASTLAKIDLKAESQASPDEVSTASLTFTDLSTIESSLKPFKEKQSSGCFTAQEKNLLKDIVTPIDNFLPYERLNEKIRFIPVLESPGGTDKDPATGLRRDSKPIAQGIADAVDGLHRSSILFFLDETQPDYASTAKESNSLLCRMLLQNATGVVVRVNPGTLSVVAQDQMEQMLAELAAHGIRIMTPPTVTRRMGAKDSLVKIRDLRCGLPDTNVYYDAESFVEGFRKTIAFRPRVVKQNRGSQGEGVWICQLKDESKYCAKFGDEMASMDTELVLTEANDNHVEYHTVGEFIEFCLNGRTRTSGTWASLGSGRYLEGGVELGAMIVDQRFLPRIVEGEVRCNMIGGDLTTLVHKIPQEGSVSATLQSGAVYTMYTPEDPKFASLVRSLREDLPNIMAALGMANEPLPLLWTADFIFDTDEDGKDIFYVGEFNCSCVGITKDLELCRKVADAAVAGCQGVHR